MKMTWTLASRLTVIASNQRAITSLLTKYLNLIDRVDINIHQTYDV